MPQYPSITAVSNSSLTSLNTIHFTPRVHECTLHTASVHALHLWTARSQDRKWHHTMAYHNNRPLNIITVMRMAQLKEEIAQMRWHTTRKRFSRGPLLYNNIKSYTKDHWNRVWHSSTNKAMKITDSMTEHVTVTDIWVSLHLLLGTHKADTHTHIHVCVSAQLVKCTLRWPEFPSLGYIGYNWVADTCSKSHKLQSIFSHQAVAVDRAPRFLLLASHLHFARLGHRAQHNYHIVVGVASSIAKLTHNQMHI